MRALLLALVPVLLAGCVSMATERMADSLSSGILNQDDPETVKDGAPAYLLMIDGFLEGDSNNAGLLMAGSRLYGAYSSVFVDDRGRAQRMADKARGYGRQAICLQVPEICATELGPYDEFVPVLNELGRSDVPVLYTYATAWAGWIQTHSGQWGAVADLPKVEALLERVVELNEHYDHGQAHLYLGVIRTQLPPALGGRPEEGQTHFERAIELSHGRNLMAKVEYARNYARLVFDKALHDRLLNEVLAADPTEPGLTLSNTLAQREARKLLATSDEYFEE